MGRGNAAKHSGKRGDRRAWRSRGTSFNLSAILPQSSRLVLESVVRLPGASECGQLTHGGWQTDYSKMDITIRRGGGMYERVAAEVRELPGDPVSRLTLAVVISGGLMAIAGFLLLLGLWHLRLARMEKSLEILAKKAKEPGG